MPFLPGLARLAALCGGVGTLVLCALLASNASAGLVSPLPRLASTLALLLWLGSIAGIVVAMPLAPLPRVVRRLLAVALFAASGWSVGTLTRAAYATLAFALADEVGEEATSWRVLGFDVSGGGARSLPATSLALNRTVSVPFDEDAVAEIAGSLACITLPIVTTEDGAARVVVPDQPLGAGDLEECAAVQYIGR